MTTTNRPLQTVLNRLLGPNYIPADPWGIEPLPMPSFALAAIFSYDHRWEDQPHNLVQVEIISWGPEFEFTPIGGTYTQGVEFENDGCGPDWMMEAAFPDLAKWPCDPFQWLLAEGLLPGDVITLRVFAPIGSGPDHNGEYDSESNAEEVCRTRGVKRNRARRYQTMRAIKSYLADVKLQRKHAAQMARKGPLYRFDDWPRLGQRVKARNQPKKRPQTPWL